jgi:hypothetical protein
MARLELRPAPEKQLVLQVDESMQQRFSEDA